MKVISEHFNTIHEYLRVSQSRPNNSVMRDCHSSTKTGESDWYGTKDYPEAEELFANGYTEILERVLKGVKESEKIHHDLTPHKKNIPYNHVIGYAPHVPNAIIGIPQSMIYTDKTIIKQKTINLLYSSAVNCNVDSESIIKAGIAVITAIKIIESSGIYVNLDIAAFITESGNEICNPTINIKRYCDRLDIQKLCFPLAHPSMERRFGFKWLETVPDITENFNWGYGHAIESADEIRRKLNLSDKVKFINIYWVMNNNYSVDKIIKYLKGEEL